MQHNIRHLQSKLTFLYILNLPVHRICWLWCLWKWIWNAFFRENDSYPSLKYRSRQKPFNSPSIVPVFPTGGHVAHRLSLLQSLLSILRVLALVRLGGLAKDMVVVLASKRHFWWKRTLRFSGVAQPFSLGFREGFGETELSLDRSLGW